MEYRLVRTLSSFLFIIFFCYSVQAAPQEHTGEGESDPDFGYAIEEGGAGRDSLLQEEAVRQRTAIVDSLRAAVKRERKFAIQELERMLGRFGDAHTQAELKLRLAELYYERDHDRYLDEYGRYDRGAREHPPRKDYSNSIELYRDVLDMEVQGEVNATAYYNLGYCLWEEEEYDDAYAAFQRLVTEYPESKYTLETRLRIGEYFFKAHKFDEAVRYYQSLMRTGDPVLFDKALYKLGWSYYKMGAFTDAISSFIYLADECEELKKLDTPYSASLCAEARDYIAYSFLEYAHAGEAIRFFDRIGGRDYAPQVIKKMGDILKRRGEHKKAIEAYTALTDEFPSSPLLLDAQFEIIGCYDVERDPEISLAVRSQFVENFGKESEWYREIASPREKMKADEFSQKALFDGGTYYHLLAQDEEDETSAATLYGKAIDYYIAFLQYYPDDEKAYQVNFNLAESYYYSGRYFEAAGEYESVAREYPQDEYREEAAYNTILCWEKVRDLIEQGVFQIQNVTPADATGQLIEGCRFFETISSDTSTMVEVYVTEGNAYHDLGNAESARRAWKNAVEFDRGGERSVEIVKSIAMSYLREGNFKEAEYWYSRLLGSSVISGDEREGAQLLIASTIYKQGETYLAAEDYMAAGGEFERAFETDPTSRVAQKALFDAASAYFKGEYFQEARKVYEKVTHTFPGSPYSAEAFYNMALCEEFLGNYTDAAENFEDFTRRYPNHEQRINALLYALEDHKKVGTREDVLRVSLNLLDYPELSIEKQIELNAEAGKLYHDKGWKKSAANYCYRCNDLYNKHPVEELAHLAARCKFLRADRFFRFYRDIRLRPPVEKNIESKRSYLKKLVSLYTDAANLKDIYWSTAATYKIGEVFEEFHDALLGSYIPETLSSEERDEYSSKLRDTAEPFREKAINAYVTNLHQAERFSEENEWVEKTRGRLLELAPEKLERPEGEGAPSTEAAEETDGEGGEAPVQGDE
jgi:tetratricopeptide (TPR) repeat protein